MSALAHVLLLSPPGKFRSLVRRTQSCTETQQNHSLRGGIVVKCIQQDLQVPTEVALPLSDYL